MLAGFEGGFAFFEVGGDAFFGVGGGEELLLEFAFEAEGFVERQLGAGDHGALDAADGGGGFIRSGEFFGVVEDLRPEILGFVNVMDEADLKGFFEFESAAGGHEFEGTGATDDAGKALGASGARKNAEIYFREADLAGAFAGNANVTGESDFETAAYSVAVERGDDQFGSLLEAAERFVGMEAEIVFEVGGGGRKHGNIRTSAEEFVAFAADEEYLNGFIEAGF